MNIMASIAIDIALIPPQEVINKAIEINQQLLKNNEKKLVLGKKKTLPHITLFMGCIEEKIFSEVRESVNKVAVQFHPLDLQVTGITTDENGYSSLKIAMTDELHLLHNVIIKKMVDYSGFHVPTDAFYKLSEADSLSAYYVENYRVKSSFQNYFPHITLGYGQTEYNDLPITFTASRLAGCHLGTQCTCQKILFEFELK